MNDKPKDVSQKLSASVFRYRLLYIDGSGSRFHATVHAFKSRISIKDHKSPRGQKRKRTRKVERKGVRNTFFKK